jgi:hypothetical protein
MLHTPSNRASNPSYDRGVLSAKLAANEVIRFRAGQSRAKLIDAR